MKNYLSLTALSGLLLVGWLFASNPNDPGSNNYTQAESVLLEKHAPPANPSIKARFSSAIDSGPAAKLANYSLRQVSPELGAGTPGGTLEDLDGDGDLDMVLTISEKIVAFENKGTRTLPRYEGEPIELVTVADYNGVGWVYGNTWDVNVTFADLDGDGDRDMICGEMYDGQVTCFFRQPGGTGLAAYGPQKRMLQDYGTSRALIEVSTDESGFAFDLSVPSVTMEDLDGDGFADLVLGDPDSLWWQPRNIQVYRGTGRFETDGSPIFKLPVALKAGGAEITLEWTMMGATCPLFHDIDNDGDRDLIVTITEGEVWIFKATGKDTDPQSNNFGLPLFAAGERLKDVDGEEIDLGMVAAASLCDYSGDGDLDLVVVSVGVDQLEENRIRILENLGGVGLNFAGPPIAIGVANHKIELRTSFTSKAVYFDFDEDGNIDVLYAGDGYGLSIAYNLDTGDDPEPRFANPLILPLSEETVDQLAEGVPDIADFDGDGKLDPSIDGVVIGTKTGLVFMRFTGWATNGLPEFAAPVSILPAGFPTLHFLQPTVGDVNGDGKLDVIIGTGSMYSGENRNLQLFLNAADNQFQLGAAEVLPVSSTGTVTYMFPEVVDIDSDGDLDLLVTDRSYGFNRRALGEGTLRVLRNVGGTVPAFSPQNLISDFAGTPFAVSRDASARVVDFDGDGKLDILVSSANSSVTPILGTGSGVQFTGFSIAPKLKVVASLPSSVLLSGGGKELDMWFPLMIHAGSYLDFNALYVGGNLTALLNQQIQFDDDRDDDGLPDEWEILHFGGINVSSGGQSSDGDWLTDLEEYQLELDPTFNDDTDGDGWLDGQETVWLNLDPTDALAYPAQLIPWADSDGDGLADALEAALGTGPVSPGQPTNVALDPVIRLFPAEYDASGATAGWINRGRIGETFVSGASKAVATTKNGKPAVEFISGQANRMVGPRVPSWMNGAGSRTVAAWVFNPSNVTTDDDVIVSWGSLSLGAPKPTLFSSRFGPNATKGALSQSGNGSLDRGWGSSQPTTGTWSFVVHRYDSKSGSMLAMRDFQAGFLNQNIYFETGIFATNGKPHAFVLGGDNDGNGGQATVKTGLAFGDVWVWDRSVPLSEIISKAYEPVRASYGKPSSLADGDGDGVPDLLETSLGWNPGNANTDGDGSPTGGGNDLAEFEQGSDPLDFHNGLPHQVTVSGGDNQMIDGGTSTSAIRFRVSDLEGNAIPNSPLEISVPADSTTLGKIRLSSASEATLGNAIAPVPVTDSAGEVSIIFKAN